MPEPSQLPADREPANREPAKREPAKRGPLLLWCALLLVAATVILVPPVRETVATLTARLRDAGGIGALGFVALYVGVTALFFPRSLANALAGWAFGPWLGGGLAWVGSVLSAAALYGVTRRFWNAEAARPEASAWAAVRQVACADPLRFTVLWRLSMVLPFSLLNLLMGVWRADWRRFVLGTALGIPPATLLQAWAGSLTADVAAVISADPSRAGEATGALLIASGAGLAVTAGSALWLARRARQALATLSNGEERVNRSR